MQLYLGIDIGGTKIDVCAGTADGQILARQRIDTHSERGAEDTLRRTAATIQQLESQTGAAEAVGIGLPGLVDAEGVAQFLPNMPGHWKGVPVTRILTEATGRRAYALNDARMATLGEFVFGAGRGCSRMLLMTLGTGIGGGLVLDGRLQRGIHGGAGEVGHQTVDPNGPMCTCGNQGCLEAFASGPAIVAAAREFLPEAASPRDVAEAAANGNEGCRALLRRTAEFLGIGMANAVTTTAVEMIVVTGGVAALSEWLLPVARDTMVKRVRMFPADAVRVCRSELTDGSGLLGALALASQHPALTQ